MYLGAEVVRSPEELVARAEDSPVWVIVGALELLVKDEKLTPAFREWLIAQPPAFIAKDGQTRVFYLDHTGNVHKHQTYAD